MLSRVSSSWSALHWYQFHTCIAPSAVHSYRVPGKFIRRLKSLFVQYEKFIRLVRIKQKFIRIAYVYRKCTDCRINIQYTYIVGKYNIYLYDLQKQAKQRAFGELFRPVSQRVQINFIFNDNVRILCLSCNVKKVGKLVRFKQRQKQVSFLAFHKCCQGCLLRSPRYISTSFILVCALRCTQLQGTRKVYTQAEKFIRRLKSVFVQYE